MTLICSDYCIYLLKCLIKGVTGTHQNVETTCNNTAHLGTFVKDYLEECPNAFIGNNNLNDLYSLVHLIGSL